MIAVRDLNIPPRPVNLLEKVSSSLSQTICQSKTLCGTYTTRLARSLLRAGASTLHIYTHAVLELLKCEVKSAHVGFQNCLTCSHTAGSPMLSMARMIFMNCATRPGAYNVSTPKEIAYLRRVDVELSCLSRTACLRACHRFSKLEFETTKDMSEAHESLRYYWLELVKVAGMSNLRIAYWAVLIMSSWKSKNTNSRAAQKCFLWRRSIQSMQRTAIHMTEWARCATWWKVERWKQGCAVTLWRTTNSIGSTFLAGVAHYAEMICTHFSQPPRQIIHACSFSHHFPVRFVTHWCMEGPSVFMRGLRCVGREDICGCEKLLSVVTRVGMVWRGLCRLPVFEKPFELLVIPSAHSRDRKWETERKFVDGYRNDGCW